MLTTKRTADGDAVTKKIRCDSNNSLTNSRTEKVRFESTFLQKKTKNVNLSAARQSLLE